MRILLAEDEQALAKAIITTLKKNNYSADAVYNGEDALYYIEEGNYDGVILDVMMPKMDGIEVLKRIRAMTRQPNSTSCSKLQYGNITLDSASFELATASGSYRLANKEYQMLEMLMSNPNQLISSERFLEKIWGYDSDVEINVVWVYISYLRKKLNALKANVQIKALRNSGYVLEVKEND